MEATKQSKLVLLVGAALAVMAISAGSAAAETIPRFTHLETGTECMEPIVEGNSTFSNCSSEASGQIALMQTPEDTIAWCPSLTANVVSDSWGHLYVEDMSFGQCSPVGRAPCYVPGPPHKSVLLDGQVVGNSESGYEAEIDVCVQLAFPNQAWFTIPFDVEVNGAGGIVGLKQQHGVYQEGKGPGIAGMELELDGKIGVFDEELSEE